MAKNPKRIQELKERFAALKQERQASIESVSLEISEYVTPARGRFPGDDRKADRNHRRRDDKIIDSTSMDAHEVATNGMHSGLTPPSRPWFRIALADEDLGKWGPVKEFMDSLQKRAYAQFRRANFYGTMHHNYGEVIAYSNCLDMMREFPEGGFYFRPFTFGEYWWSRNHRGKVDMVFREEFLYAKQLVEEFGESAVSKQVRDAIRNNKPYQTFSILHAVEPRQDADRSRKDRGNMPWASTWMELGGDCNILLESGFETFPYAAGSWFIVGADQYGCDSPAARKLPDVKQLQDMEESCLMAVHQELDPALKAPSTMAGSPIRRSAGGITYYDTNPEGLQRLYEFKFDIAAGEAKSQQIRERVRKGFYNDLFRMFLEENMRGNVTATQIMQMQAQNMMQVGPFIERMEDELLDPHVIFTVERMMRRPWLYDLPPIPQELAGADYKVEYISLLAQAQRMLGIRSIDETVQFAMTTGQADPSSLDLYNFDELGRERAELVGAPGKGIRTEDAVQQIRQQRAQKQQEMEQAQTAMAAVQGAKTLGDTPVDGEQPSLLTELLGGGVA